MKLLLKPIPILLLSSLFLQSFTAVAARRERTTAKRPKTVEQSLLYMHESQYSAPAALTTVLGSFVGNAIQAFSSTTENGTWLLTRSAQGRFAVFVPFGFEVASWFTGDASTCFENEGFKRRFSARIFVYMSIFLPVTFGIWYPQIIIPYCPVNATESNDSGTFQDFTTTAPDTSESPYLEDHDCADVAGWSMFYGPLMNGLIYGVEMTTPYMVRGLSALGKSLRRFTPVTCCRKKNDSNTDTDEKGVVLQVYQQASNKDDSESQEDDF